MLKIKKITCRCGLVNEMRKAYQLCVSCNSPLIYDEKLTPRCFVYLREGKPKAKRKIKKGELVEDVYIYGRFNHKKAVKEIITSGFVGLYQRDKDTPNVSLKRTSQEWGRVVALTDIQRGEEIRINAVGDK